MYSFNRRLLSALHIVNVLFEQLNEIHAKTDINVVNFLSVVSV